MHLLLNDVLKKIGLKYDSRYPINIDKLTYNKDNDELDCLINVHKDENKDNLSEFIQKDLLDFIAKINIEFIEYENSKTNFSKDILIKILKSADFCEYSSCVDFESLNISDSEISIVFNFEQIRDKFISDQKDIELSSLIKQAYNLSYSIKSKIVELRDNDDYIKNLKEYDNSIREKIAESIKDTPRQEKEEVKKTGIKCGKDIEKTPIKIKEIIENEDDTCIKAEIIDVDVRSIKDGKSFIVSLDLRDESGAVLAKKFLKKNEYEAFGDKLKSGVYLLLTGRLEFDRFTSGKSFSIKQMQEIEKPESRKDEYYKKRVELHMYSQMSQLDGFIDLDECCKTLKKWGHTALGLTDKSVVQGYPQLYEACSNNGLKPLFGMEAKILEDDFRIIT
ncbi:MAG: PHP domain-containing protein, partial [Anaerococcus vaginalis]|nr:PHP domain-containing protein [Anaerococcus vaginalis]